MAARKMKIDMVPVGDLREAAGNARTHSAEQVDQLAGLIREYGFTQPILVDGDGEIIAGHGRLRAAKVVGLERVPVIHIQDLTPAQVRAYRLADNKVALNAGWNVQVLAAELDALKAGAIDLSALGFSDLDLKRIQFEASGAASRAGGKGSLAARFGVPPFSVLNARDGWWQERKRAWLALGLKSELGRGEMQGTGAPSARSAQKAAPGGAALPAANDGGQRGDGRGRSTDGVETWVTSSIFDPVLCELAYRWFAPPGGLVLDPFAGGSVRGIVAAKLGRRYVGIDLSARQVEANRAQVALAGDGPRPEWIVGDSRNIDSLAPDVMADFVFSCPPYADLERYSDDPRDLSTMQYDDFVAAYNAVIATACARLLDDRFAMFVVGDVRDAAGLYRNFVGHTVAAFEAAGLRLYNDAVLVTAVGSLPVRAGSQFAKARKFGKTHQNVLVFVKGNPKTATEAVGDVDFGDEEQAATAGDGVTEL